MKSHVMFVRSLPVDRNEAEIRKNGCLGLYLQVFAGLNLFGNFK